MKFVEKAGTHLPAFLEKPVVKIQAAYSDWSATYDSDRNLTRDLDQIVTKQTLGKLKCESILELGCGTGKNTELLAGIGARLHALDFSSGMIERAKAKLALPNVIFEIADITRRWPCPDESVDLVVCNLVLEHIQDLSFIFSEAVRVLMNGGCFFVCELHPFRQYQGTVARFQRTETTEIPAFVHHLTNFTDAAKSTGLSVVSMKEWWHQEDNDKPPRLVSFMFEKGSGTDFSP
jgi:ubiquinone/menaquinone biosynthesis C-methylase UbiE